MVRRRPRELAVKGTKIPESVLKFVPADWPACGSDYQQWVGWQEARVAWAEANLPNGTRDLPSDVGRNLPPDQPWSEVVL